MNISVPPTYSIRLSLSSFSGKERDEETGYSYFGARYYDAELTTTWLSVDPMTDKYPSLSPYAYCAWSPVKLVDPDGKEIMENLDWYKKKGTSTYTWFDGSSEHQGYTHIGGKGSLLGEYEPYVENILTDHNGFNHVGLYTNGVSVDFSDKDKRALTGSNGSFFGDFLKGCGPEISIMYADHPYTQMLQKNNKSIDQAHRLI